MGVTIRIQSTEGTIKVKRREKPVFIDPPPTKARSALMAKVREQGTAPELAVRSVAHSMGYRFRLHKRDLPGSPDIVFPARHKVIFVHGCFWHRHPCAWNSYGDGHVVARDGNDVKGLHARTSQASHTTAEKA